MFKFPYTNLHELNLDWILEKVKHFAELIPSMETAVGDVQSLTDDVAQAVEDANKAVEDAQSAIETAEEAKEIAEQAAQGTIADGAVTTPKLASEAVTTAKIDDGAVTSAKLATNAAVDNIDTNSLNGLKISNNSIVTDKLTAGCVTNPKILDSAVTTPKIADEAVTFAKLADNAKLKYVDSQSVTITQNSSGGYSTIGNIYTDFNIPQGALVVSFFIKGWSSTNYVPTLMLGTSGDTIFAMIDAPTYPVSSTITVRVWYLEQ